MNNPTLSLFYFQELTLPGFHSIDGKKFHSYLQQGEGKCSLFEICSAHSIPAFFFFFSTRLGAEAQPQLCWILNSLSKSRDPHPHGY